MVCYSLVEKYLISASMDNTLRLWSIEVKSCVYTQFLDIPATSINVKDKKLMLMYSSTRSQLITTQLIKEVSLLFLSLRGEK